MKLEDIKNMSDEDFIILVKNVMKKAEENLPIKTTSLYANPKEFYRMIKLKNFCEYMVICACVEITEVIGLLTILGLIQNGYIKAEIFENKENAIMVTCLFFLILPLLLIRPEHKKEKKKLMDLEKKGNDDILKLKRLLENFSEKDFETLIENIKSLQETSINDDEIKSSNVVLVANQLIELNATGILNEFETMQANEPHKNYNDAALDMGYSKNIKGNN